jgi:hypothetical protein
MLVGQRCSAESLLRRYSELRREGNFPGSKLSGFCSGGIRNSAEKGISQGANCHVFAPAVFEIRRAPHVFLYRFAHFPVVLVRVATLLIYLTKNPPNRIPPEQKLLCGKFSSKRKTRANVHPDRRHFERIGV